MSGVVSDMGFNPLENVMVASEREMVRKYPETAAEKQERFTSLQPTYEDSVPNDEDVDWDDDRTS